MDGLWEWFLTVTGLGGCEDRSARFKITYGQGATAALPI
jgi:hypothetical protein